MGREFPCKPQNPKTMKERSYIFYCVKTLSASGKIPDSRKLQDKQQICFAACISDDGLKFQICKRKADLIEKQPKD